MTAKASTFCRNRVTSEILQACNNITIGHVVKLLRDIPGYCPPYTTNPDSVINGRINPSLLELKHILFLDLSYNAFNGTPISSFLGFIVQLRHLNLLESRFEGRIPPQLGNLVNLVGNAQECGIPRSIGDIILLGYLQLSFDRVANGSLPSTMSNLTGLKRLHLLEYRLPIIPDERRLLGSKRDLQNVSKASLSEWKQALTGKNNKLIRRRKSRSAGCMVTAVLPAVEGVQGILAAYSSALHNVSLAGPTLFGKDGVVTDLQETKDAIVRASDLPLSILIVGVGGADFKDMEVLDADNGQRLEGSTGRIATRDIVQFVPMRDVHSEYLYY
ncbi:hypothetical protein ACLOJK_025407 [Asimina triloba]